MTNTTLPRIVALLTKDGTACSETALLDSEDTPAARARIESMLPTGHDDDPIAGTWTDVTENEAIQEAMGGAF